VANRSACCLLRIYYVFASTADLSVNTLTQKAMDKFLNDILGRRNSSLDFGSDLGRYLDAAIGLNNCINIATELTAIKAEDRIA